jgi:hypothetical protein
VPGLIERGRVHTSQISVAAPDFQEANFLGNSGEKCSKFMPFRPKNVPSFEDLTLSHGKGLKREDF